MAFEASEVRDRLAALDVEERNVNDLARHGMRPAKYRRLMDEIIRERDQLDRQLAAVESAEASGYDECRRRWETQTFGEKRAVLGSLLVQVRVRPGVPGRSTFDPGRVVICPGWSPLIASAERAEAEGLLTEAAWQRVIAVTPEAFVFMEPAG